jgi:hypothetical protein
MKSLIGYLNNQQPSISSLWSLLRALLPDACGGGGGLKLALLPIEAIISVTFYVKLKAFYVQDALTSRLLGCPYPVKHTCLLRSIPHTSLTCTPLI